MHDSVPYRWLYIDFNSYFASVEQQLNPSLRGKPVVVVPVETDATCAIAASYEAKRFGIKTGTWIYEAKKMCPQLICVLARHESYVDFHHRIIAEVEKHLPVSKVCSIDEMACQLMDNEGSEEKVREIALRIKRGLFSHIGESMRCSIGIAPNCYLAKVATDMQKPDGLTLIRSSELPAKLYSLKLSDLPGIGRNMELRLSRQGIRTMETLCGLDLPQMRKAWGSVWGERMWHHLRGIDLPDLETKRSSLGHSHVLAPEFRTPDKARIVAIRLTLKCASRLRRMHLTAAHLSLSIKTEEGDYHERSAKCHPASDSHTFVQLALELWQAILNSKKLMRIKKISVTLLQLTEASSLQPDLFEQQTDWKERQKSERISQALDTINQRYGRDSILLGILPKEGRTLSNTKVAFTRIPDQEEFLE
jgi:DNA polymerase-4